MHLGIYGGSFDPVHLGHLTLARCCAEQRELAEVWFVPAAHQPLKPGGPQATDRQRLEMLQLALAGQEAMHVSEIEIERGGVSYTVDTLHAVKQQRPDADIFFLMGADSLADFPQWHQPERILELATPLIVRRAGAGEPDYQVLASFVSAGRLQAIIDARVEMPAVPISSSEIRRLVASGGTWQTMVPERVAKYVEEHRLYRA